MTLSLIINATSSEYPIDQLFQAICVLQYLDECEDEVKVLTQKLETYWENIPEQNGKKLYDRRVRYYPSGLCENAGYSILLAPWEPSTETKQKGKAVNYRGLKEVSIIWYYMLKQQMGGIHETIAWDFNYAEFFKKWQAKQLLSDNNTKLIDLGETWVWERNVGELINDLPSVEINGKQIRFFPKKEELAECIAIGKLSSNNSQSYDAMLKYIDKVVKPAVNLEDHDRLTLDFSSLYKNFNRYDRDMKFKDNYVDDVVGRLQVLFNSITDQKVVKVLQKLQIVE